MEQTQSGPSALAEFAAIECERLKRINIDLLVTLHRIADGTVPAIDGGTPYTDTQAYALAAIERAQS